MYVKDHINCTVVLSKSVPKKFELLVLKLQLSLYVSVRFDFTNERFIVLCSLKLSAGYSASDSQHYTGDPDVGLAEASGTKTNMANNAFIKLPEL